MKEGCLVTHVFNRLTEGKEWIKAPYLIKKEGGGYYAGENSVHEWKKKKREELIKGGYLITLEPPVRKNSKQDIWINSNHEIYLALKENPVEDPDKIFLGKINELQT